MGSVSDHRSLMVLPDDVLLLTLSFMEGKKRVRLSRACKRMSCVVDQSLAGVKKLHYEKWFGSKLDKYKTKVFSKLLNLEEFCAKTHNKLFCERIARVLAKNCPNLRDMRCYTRITQAYAEERHETGSLKLEFISLTGSSEWDIQFVKELLQSYPNIRVKAFDFDYAYDPDSFWNYLGDAVDVIRNRTTDFQFGKAFQDCLRLHKLKLILTWSNIRVLNLDPNTTIDRQTLQSILNSLPKLQELQVAMDIQDFDLLTCAKQQWTSVSNLLFCSETTGKAGKKPEEQHCRNLMQFIIQREHALQKFSIWLSAAFADNADLMNFIFSNCKKMTHFRMDGGILLTYSPKKRKLCLEVMSWESLQPILRLYPKTKSIEITIKSSAGRSFAAKWKEQIAAFAATKKGYAVRSEIIMK